MRLASTQLARRMCTVPEQSIFPATITLDSGKESV